MRRLAAPSVFRAALPFGPDREGTSFVAQAASIAAGQSVHIDLHDDYAKWLSLVERRLSDICGHNEEERRRHAGRADGPSFTWHNACGPPVKEAIAASAVARA